MPMYIEFDNQPDPYYYAPVMASALHHAIIDEAPEHGEWTDSEGRRFLDTEGEISDRHTLIRICNKLWQTLVHYPKPLLATSVPFGHLAVAKQLPSRPEASPPPAESEEVKKNRRGFARAVQQANALELALEYAIQHAVYRACRDDRQVSLVWTATSGPHRGEG